MICIAGDHIQTCVLSGKKARHLVNNFQLLSSQIWTYYNLNNCTTQYLLQHQDNIFTSEEENYFSTIIFNTK